MLSLLYSGKIKYGWWRSQTYIFPQQSNKEARELEKPFDCDATIGGRLWTDGLICAFECVRSWQKMVQSKCDSKIQSPQHVTIEICKKQDDDPNSLCVSPSLMHTRVTIKILWMKTTAVLTTNWSAWILRKSFQEVTGKLDGLEFLNLSRWCKLISNGHHRALIL